jgi:hypothetical protein
VKKSALVSFKSPQMGLLGLNSLLAAFGPAILSVNRYGSSVLEISENTISSSCSPVACQASLVISSKVFVESPVFCSSLEMELCWFCLLELSFSYPLNLISLLIIVCMSVCMLKTLYL